MSELRLRIALALLGSLSVLAGFCMGLAVGAR